jgi:ring-1,2-phenylacetyl-CoA epoxidase subunit PaaB
MIRGAALNKQTQMTIKSLDPRVTRAEIPENDEKNWAPLGELDQHETYEVFHQEIRGGQPVHVGSLHAPNPEMALLFAKEQYARRAKCVSIWVVRTADIYTIGVDDADIFETTPEKDYREAKGYRVGGKITAFKRNKNVNNG